MALATAQPARVSPVNPHVQHSATPHEMAMSLLRNYKLIAQMVQREVLGRYKGSFMGLAWSFIVPLLMLLVYTFFFSVVFKVRWTGLQQQTTATFAVVLFVGMIVYGVFAECINRAPNLVVSNTNFVKKVIFPLDVLPWVSLGSALFHAAVSLLVLL